MSVRFHITPGSTTPIFRQIVEQVRTAVATGELAVGAALPSVRALAAQLVVNPNTVSKAYTELCQSGVAQAERGRGVFIAAQRQLLSDGERKRRLNALADTLVREATLLGFSRQEGLALVAQRWASIPENEDES